MYSEYLKTLIFFFKKNHLEIAWIPFGEGMESYGSGKTLVRKNMSLCKMVEGRPATHLGIYKLLDHVPQGEKKSNSLPKTKPSKQKYLAKVSLFLWKGLT